MTDPYLRERLWSAIQLERRAIADDLADLDDDAWPTPSLCAMWTVEDGVAHLIAGRPGCALSSARTRTRPRNTGP